MCSWSLGITLFKFYAFRNHECFTVRDTATGKLRVGKAGSDGESFVQEKKTSHCAPVFEYHECLMEKCLTNDTVEVCCRRWPVFVSTPLKALRLIWTEFTND